MMRPPRSARTRFSQRQCIDWGVHGASRDTPSWRDGNLQHAVALVREEIICRLNVI